MIELWESMQAGRYRVVFVDHDATDRHDFALTLQDGLSFGEAGKLTESLAVSIEWREQAEEYAREHGASGSGAPTMDDLLRVLGDLADAAEALADSTDTLPASEKHGDQKRVIPGNMFLCVSESDIRDAITIARNLIRAAG